MDLIWLDLETTGLNAGHDGDSILEVAVSRATLEAPFEASPLLHMTMFFSPAYHDTMDPKVLAMHTKNGLLAECAASRGRPWVAEQQLCAVVPAIDDPAEMPVLAGSSVHFDLAFLRTHMPTFAARFSHRLYDVSAVKLFCRSLGMDKLPRAEAHRAQDDIAESIDHARRCASWLAERFGG